MRDRFAHGDHGIDEQHEVRTRACTFDRIVARGRTRVEVRSCRGRQVPTRREADDSDAVWIHAEFLGARACRSNRTLRVAKHHWVVVARSKPVAHHESRDAAAGKPVRDIDSLVPHGEMLIASTGEYHDRRSVGALLAREVRRHFRSIERIGAERAGCTSDPQRDCGLGARDGRWWSGALPSRTGRHQTQRDKSDSRESHGRRR